MKFLHLFGTFYDTNGDGHIDWQDFIYDVEKVCKIQGWGPDSEMRKKAESTLKGIWDGLRNMADLNQDDRISQFEWLKYWGEVAKSGDMSKLPDWVERYIEFMFRVNDVNGDDWIDIDEFKKVFSEYGVSEGACENAFNAVTQNGTIKLDLAQYKKLWHQYFLSKDPKDPGNALFGVRYVK